MLVVFSVLLFLKCCQLCCGCGFWVLARTEFSQCASHCFPVVPGKLPESSCAEAEATKVLRGRIPGAETVGSGCGANRLHELVWSPVFPSVPECVGHDIVLIPLWKPLQKQGSPPTLTKNSFCLQWYAVPFLYRCFPLQRATFSYLLADVFLFFNLSISAWRACSYTVVRYEQLHYCELGEIWCDMLQNFLSLGISSYDLKGIGTNA